MAQLIKCYQNRPDCFAVTDDGKCMLLQSYVRDGGILGKERRYGTKFKGGCPFYKTAEASGGTYDELCERYPLPFDPEDRKL